MAIAVLTIHLYFPGCTSLKAKRSRIKPILARLHKEFNLSVAEMDRQDQWQESLIACAMIGNDGAFLQKVLNPVVDFIPRIWPEVQVLEHHIELI